MIKYKRLSGVMSFYLKLYLYTNRAFLFYLTKNVGFNINDSWATLVR